MASSLGVGLSAAKTLAAVLQKPLVYVHHMQAHALTPLLTEESPPEFPFLVLLVSGGHTMLVLSKGVSEFRVLVSTSDDSIGDSFDKVARDLGIPWTSAPGKELERLAEQHQGKGEGVSFPIPCKGQAMFSYSGLKAAVQRHVEAKGIVSDGERASIAQAFQEAAVGQLEDKLSLTLRPSTQRTDGRGRVYPRLNLERLSGDEIKTVVCSGGVASNIFLRQRLRQALDELGRKDVELQFPPLSLCTDNAAMIAWTGHLLWHQRTHGDYSRQARAKWSIEDIPQ